MRAKRIFKASLLLLFTGFFFMLTLGAAASSSFEQEPNDTPQEANLMASGERFLGMLRDDNFENPETDEDYLRIFAGAGGTLSVYFRPSWFVNTCFEILDPDLEIVARNEGCSDAEEDYFFVTDKTGYYYFRLYGATSISTEPWIVEATFDGAPSAPDLALRAYTPSSVSLLITPGDAGAAPIQSFTTSCTSDFTGDLSAQTPVQSVVSPQMPDARNSPFDLGKPTGQQVSRRSLNNTEVTNGKRYDPTPGIWDAKPGDYVTFTAPDGSAVSAIVDSTSDTDFGNRLLKATSADTTIIAVINATGEFFAEIQTALNHYQSVILEDQTIVFDEAEGELAPNPFLDDAVFIDTTSGTTQNKELEVASLSSKPTVVSLGVLYDSNTANAYDEFALIDLYVALANKSYQNSGVNIIFDVVASDLYNPFLSQSDMGATLNYISCGSTICDPLSTDNSEVIQWRNANKADLVVQIVRYGTNGSTCGIAWAPSTASHFTTYLKNLTYSVNAIELPDGRQCSDLVVAHEMGHNFGLGHDRSTGCSGTYYPYACGYKVDGVFGTVMSYVPNSLRINALSNPYATYNGYPTGVPIGQSGEAYGAAAVSNVMSFHEAIYANPDLERFFVTPSSSAGGAISPIDSQVVKLGDTIDFTVTPDADYGVSSIGGTCPEGTLSGDTYTTGAIVADCTVIVNFNQVTWQETSLSKSVTFNGLPANTLFQCQTVATNQFGSSYPSTIYVTTDGTQTFFKVRAYSADIESGEVSPDIPVTVESGSSATFQILPHREDFQFAAVDGTCPYGEFTLADVYTTGAIQEDCEVWFYFPRIKAESGDGEISVYLTDSGGASIEEYEVTCTGCENQVCMVGSMRSETSPIHFGPLSNDVEYACSVRVKTGTGWSWPTQTRNLVPEEIIQGLPIWLLYQATQ